MDTDHDLLYIEFAETIQDLDTIPPSTQQVYVADFSLLFWFLGIQIVLLILLVFKKR